MRIFDFLAAPVAEPRELLPDDPRARQVLRNLRQPPPDRSLRGEIEPASAASSDRATWLYWILRMTQPERVWVSGIPAAVDLISLAAAVADGGGRRVLCLDEAGRSARSAIVSLVADAGLDWLVRFREGPAGHGLAPDALVIADGNEVGVACAIEALDLASGPKLIVALGGASEASGPAATLRRQLLAQGFRTLLPEAAPSGLWAALARDERR